MQPGKVFLIRIAWFFILILALLQLVANTQIQTDIESFLPSGSNDKQHQLLSEIHRGSNAGAWLIAITGESQDVDKERVLSLSRKLLRQLRESSLFSSVLNGPSDDEGIFSGKLFQYRYLLNESIERDPFAVSQLRESLQQQLDEMRSPFSSFSKQLLVSDPTAAMLQFAERLQHFQSGLETRDGLWFNEKENRAFLLAHSKQAGSDIDAQEQVYRKILSVFKQEVNAGKITIIATGPPLFAVVTRDTIRQESRQLSLMAGVFMLVFMYFVFRNGTLVILSMLPLGGGLLVAGAAVSLLYGNIHGITLAFGITLLGVAIDYPVHLFMHARKTGSLQQAAVSIWPVLRLGVLTTVLGYGAMIWTDFRGLSQLGVFSVTGLITAALITLTLLPALQAEVPRRKLALPAGLPRLFNARWMSVAGAALLIFMLVVLSAYKYVIPEDIWSHNIAELSPVPAALIQQDKLLRGSAGLPDATSLIRVDGGSAEDVLRIEEQLKSVLQKAVQAGLIKSYIMASDLIPSSLLQSRRQERLPDRELLSMRVEDAMAGLPFKAESFQPFIDAVEATKSLQPLVPEDLEGTTLATLLDNLLSEEGGRSTGRIRLIGLDDSNRRLDSLIKEAALPGISVIKLKAGTNSLMEDLRREILQRIGWISGGILLLLLISLKSVKAGIRVVVPVVLAVLFAGLVPLLLGESLNLFHLVSLLLVIGLSLDYALFFNSINRNAKNAESVSASLLVCSISSLVVFAMLGVSGIPVLHAIGVTVASGVIAAFILSWMIAWNRMES